MSNNADISRRVALGIAAATAATATATGAFGAKKSRDTGFLWGAATAAHQIEGGNWNSDYWALEHIPATYFKEPSGDACDSFHRWREDLELVRAGGMNSYRFSIEWARIEPENGEFSPAALDHYRTICITARKMGIEPVVTFHHFTSPRWIAAMGGWENPETANHFARYCEVAAKALAGTFGWACTMNEPNAQVTSMVMANGKLWDKQPTVLAQAAKAVNSLRFGAYFLGDAFKVRDVCLAAHAKARTAIKAAAPGVKVGLTLALQQFVAGPGGDKLYKRVWDNARLPFYQLARDDDFIGVQTYNKGLIGPAGYLPSPNAVMLDAAQRDASPGALAVVAQEAHRETRVPVFVTEHGMSSIDDALRQRHLRESLAELAVAIDGGLPVLGYMHWSLLDNFEWTAGYEPRFGLVEVDRKTFYRTPKPSLKAYRRLIAELRARHRWA